MQRPNRHARRLLPITAALAITVTTLSHPAAGSRDEAPPVALAPKTTAPEIDAKAREVLDLATFLTFGPTERRTPLTSLRISGHWATGGEIQVPDSSVSISLDDHGRLATRWEVPPLEHRPTGTRSPGMLIRSGFDGSRGWTIHEAKDGRIRSGSLLSDTETSALRIGSEFFFGNRDWSTIATRIDHAGQVDVELDADPTLPSRQKYTRPCHKIIFTMRSGTQEVHFFDVEMGVLIKNIADGRTILYGDYREVQGMLWPFLMTYRLPAQSQTLKITGFEINPTLSPEDFSPPQSLIDREIENARLRSRLDSPDMRARLQLFTTPGRWQPGTVKTDPNAEPRPMSFDRIKRSGALNKGYGLQALFQIVTPRTQGQGNRIRPLDDMRPKLSAFPRSFNRLSPDQRRQLEELQDLLNTLGPMMVEMKMLDP